jgi:hypothetical protein
LEVVRDQIFFHRPFTYRYFKGATTVDSIQAIPYDPDWRKQFNVGAPPRPLKLRSGTKDVEHVF